eukprot:978514-Prorocentrum_minimum.AAC.1
MSPPGTPPGPRICPISAGAESDLDRRTSPVGAGREETEERSYGEDPRNENEAIERSDRTKRRNEAIERSDRTKRRLLKIDLIKKDSNGAKGALIGTLRFFLRASSSA